MEIASNLPNVSRIAYAAVHFIFGTLGVSLEDVRTIFAQGQSYRLLPAKWDVALLYDECAYLLAFPADPTKEQMTQISPHVKAILQQFGIK